MKPCEFWELTPKEFKIVLEVYADKQRERYNDLIYVAWHVEAFQRQKKLPKLSELIKTKKTKKQIQTDEDMFNVVKSINSMYGGEVV